MWSPLKRYPEVEGGSCLAVACCATAVPATPPTGELLGRMHFLWECPVARAVVEEVERQLPLEVRPLGRRALWLGEAQEGVTAACGRWCAWQRCAYSWSSASGGR